MNKQRRWKKNEEDDVAAGVMNDMVLAFGSIVMLLAIIFLILMRFEDFTEEKKDELLEVHAEENAQVVYDLEKGVDTEKLALEQEMEVQLANNYQGNYGGTITEVLSRTREHQTVMS